MADTKKKKKWLKSLRVILNGNITAMQDKRTDTIKQ